VDILVKRRCELAQNYGDAIKHKSVQLPSEQLGYKHSYRNYVIRVAQREQVQARLADAGVSSSLMYTPPLHLQPVYQKFGFGRGSFPVAEAACDSQLSIPLRPDLSKEQQSYVIETLLSVL